MKHILTMLLSLLLLAVSCGGNDDAGAVDVDAGAVPVDVAAIDTPPVADTPAPDLGGEAVDTVETVSASEVSEERLSLAAVSPAVGPTEGGTPVMLTGSGFNDSLRVTFGETEAENLFVIDEHFVTCDTPAGGAGRVDVTVLLSEGESGRLEARLPAAFLYEDELYVERVVPDEGPVEGGTSVRIEGHGFTKDAVIAIGGRLAIETESIDSETLQAITPPGSVGPADVSVLIHGRTTVHPDGFAYRDPLRLDRVEPGTGETLGDELVVLVGRGFDDRDDSLQVWFGDWEAEVLSASSEGHELIVRTPPGSPGATDVRVATEGDQALLSEGFVYIDPSFVASGFSLHAVVPGQGSSAGGEAVSLVVTALSATPAPEVFFGDAAATVVAHDAPSALVRVLTPPHEVGSVDVRVVQDWKETARSDGYTYEAELAVRGIAPASGPAEGGTLVTVTGVGFAPESTLYVGALPCTDLVFVDESMLRGRTAPGSPGSTDVRVVQGTRSAQLTGAYTYESTVSALLGVEPSRGSQAGGTYVRFLGLGIPEVPEITMGGEPCVEVQRVSSTEAIGYSPRAEEPGSVDVVLTGPLGEQYVVADGFTYFDPTSYSGGTWGGPIDGTVNVTVLDGSTGWGLPEAFVILGDDPATPFQGLTDDRGQITFSAPGLRGPVSLTAVKSGYTSYSVIEFDAENITVWLNAAIPPQAGGSIGGVPALEGLVSGRVTNAEKYLLIPPGRCEDAPGAPWPLCEVCDTDADCGGDGYCILLDDEGRVCATDCEDDGACPSGFVCRDVSSGLPDLCIPRGGEPAIFCRQTDPSYYGGAPSPGAFYEVNQHHEYLINTDLGELAIYCVAGAYSQQNGDFLPLAMGIRRHLLVSGTEPLTDVDVTLNIPLTNDLRLLFADPPRHESGLQTPYVRGSIDLGSDGHIRFANLLASPELSADGTRLVIPGHPESFTGDIYDGKYVFYVTLAAATTYGVPYSTVYVDEAWPEQAETLYHRAADGTWTQPSSGLPDELVALGGTSDNDLFAVSAGGSIYRRSAAGWSQQPVSPGAPLTDLAGVSSEDGIRLWAVGERGRALFFGGSYWQSLPRAPGRTDLVAVTADSTERMFAAGDEGTIFAYEATTGEWRVLRSGAERWEDLQLVDGTLWAVGAQGVIAGFDGNDWTFVATATQATLHAVHGNAAQGLFAVGAAGIAYHDDGSGWRRVMAPTVHDLRDVRVLPDATVLAVGDSGDRFSWEEGAWLPVDDGFEVHRHLYRVHATDDGSLWLLGPRGFVLGPFMGFPRFIQPEEGQALTEADWSIHWSAQGEAVPTFNQLTLAETTGYTFWTTILDGGEWSFPMPPLETLLDMDTIRPGPFRLLLTRALNPDFDIDDYTSRDLSTSRRTTWSTNYIVVTAE